MTIRIDIFDVGRGEAVLVELPSNEAGAKSVGIVDCYCGPDNQHPLLERLRELDAGNLSFAIEFLVITHYHADHFLGISSILREFGTRIRRFYDSGLNPMQIMLAEFFTNHAGVSRARSELKAVEEFKEQNVQKVRPLIEPRREIYNSADNSVRVRSEGPPPDHLMDIEKLLKRFVSRAKRRFQSDREVYEHSSLIPERYDLNRSSSAISILCNGKKCILGGDMLRRAWRTRVAEEKLDADLFLLSHHGSADAFPRRSWARCVRDNSASVVVSGRGRGQPAKCVRGYLKDENFNVWTTDGQDTMTVDQLQSYVETFHFESTNANTTSTTDVTCYLGGDSLIVQGPQLLASKYEDDVAK